MRKRKICLRRDFSMKKFLVLFLGLAFMGVVGYAKKVDIQAEQQKIKEVLDGYVTSIENEDMALYGKVVAHDADMVNFGSGAADRIVGWNALEKAIQDQNAALSGTEITVSDETIKISPDGQSAWATSLWNFKALMGEQALELPVRCTWILEKREAGWVIVHFHKSVGMK
jgi:ketosteroid isomerase-like protein